MAYLFLSFWEHLEAESKRRSDLYSASLIDQFENLQKRIPQDRKIFSFPKFIECCFKSGFPRKYYISCPNFLREIKNSDDGKPTYLNNVVVRPEMSLELKRYLPDNQNIILIGDVFDNGKLRCLQVKGIEFIDADMSSPNDMMVNAAACISLERQQWSVSRVDYNDTVFTPDFIQDLITTCYTVKNPKDVRKTYEEWNKYIEFRNYYLEEQSKRNFHLDSCEFIDSYAVNRKEYRMNSTIYDDYILDNVEIFKNGDMVVLSSKVADAEPFPLVKLTIDRNKKEFENAKVLKGNKKVNEEERKIRSLASDNVLITTLDPHSDEAKDNKGKCSFGILLRNGYELGDRFRIIAQDIEPIEHLDALDYQYENDVKEAFANIDAKYSKKIDEELKASASICEHQITDRISSLTEKKKQELGSTIDNDVKNNSDLAINKQIEKEKNKIRASVQNNTKKNNKESDEDFKERVQKIIDENISKIDIRHYYEDRNNNMVFEFESKLINDGKKELSQYKETKLKELKNKYSEDIRSEKIAKQKELDTQLKADKEKAIEEETIHRFSLYFRLGDINNEIKDKQKDIIKKCQYIVYDNRAEKAKIKRQQTALENFYSGYVKNPYLSTYLFNPEELQPSQADYSDWVWYLNSLNEKQKEAVRKAVASNGVFLLQGPPGTGKTQVIAETVAQMVKKGKKVLISSETHKALDNVFERLPKIAEIVPIRLIPSNNRKSDNDYDPKFLVDNFYKNIRTNMLKAVDRYNNFSKNKEEFGETFGRLQLLKSKIDKNQAVLDKANDEIHSFEKETTKLSSQIAELNDKNDELRLSLEGLRRTIRHIEKNNLKPDEDIETDVILKLHSELKDIISGNGFTELETDKLVSNIVSIKTDEINRELSLLDPNTNASKLEVQIEELKSKMKACKDDFDDVLPEKVDEYASLQKELRKAINDKNSLSQGSSNTDLKLCGIFKYQYLVEYADKVKDSIEELKSKIGEAKAHHIEKLNETIETLNSKSKALDNEIVALKNQIKEINDQIIDIQERSDIRELQESKRSLELQINKFFKDFEISEPYKDVDEGLMIISKKWQELETDYKRKEKENKEKIPMYKEISDYLSMDEVIEEDRKTYTKDLFESANVFGITCTSNDRFGGNNMDVLSEYNIDEINIKSIGIDVVIIDEVSKSSFIDLLIPILYGKTVILVGDHRQLPPMYEFSKLRDDDFEGLDENVINKDTNKKFTELYEECFFKTLFEKIPDSYKTMLVQQYRCHEHIMNVFNSFYQGELKLGFAGQNNTKNHNIKLISNGRTIIEPEKHIYFVDCKGKETHEQDSTSMYNTDEAEVVAELLKKINDYFKRNQGIEKLSIGVICTYGDQARKIKEVNKREHVKTDAFKTDSEKMIISTVDDFQGDERDIIILSTVRNPENPTRSNPGFINAYQRINVALSRARRLLIVVGNRKYLEDRGVIDLPDVHGKSHDRRNFHVYEEIIGTIERYGKIIDDTDVLGEKEARING